MNVSKETGKVDRVYSKFIFACGFVPTLIWSIIVVVPFIIFIVVRHSELNCRKQYNVAATLVPDYPTHDLIRILGG